MSLNVLTYNFYSRPRQIFKDSQVARAKKFSERLEAYEIVNGEIDILLLQEIFDNKVHKILKKDLKSMGFIFRTKRIDTWNRMNGGGIIYSRWPITTQDNYMFKKAYIFNAPAAKGANYARVLKEDKIFHFINVHLDSFDADFRKGQMVNIKKWIDSKYIPSDEPVIMGGDYNIDLYNDEVETIEEIFEDYDIPEATTIKDQEWTKYTLHSKNDWIARRGNLKEQNEWLDFFICKSEDIETEMKVVKLEQPVNGKKIVWNTPFFFNIYSCKKNYPAEDISDHYGCLCTIKY